MKHSGAKLVLIFCAAAISAFLAASENPQILRVGVGLAVASAVSALWLARSLLASIREIAGTAKTFSELEKMRRDFVANVSHELRTPLASIKGLAETLCEGAIDDPEHRFEFVQDIEKEAQRLAALVDDLLDLSAIESGHRQPVKEAIALMALAREAAAGLKSLADRKKVSIHIQEPEAPALRADRSQIKQVFTNLIDNAIKYNHKGGSITVSAAQEGSWIDVSVRDTGQGIPESDLPRVFERFYRVDKARSQEIGGTGLGLSIVKHIVEIHGGTTSVESKSGHGSTFHVRLPTGG